MKISIALPSYNHFNFIDACIRSIQNQDYHDFEVLIADGGSSDGSLDIIKNICDQDPRFKLVSKFDKGQADAIVKAYSFATGEIFCFLNSDDCFICSDALSSVAKAFDTYRNVDIISFSGYYIDAIGKYIKPVNLRYHPLDNFGLMKYRTAVLQPATFWRNHVYMSVPILTEFHYVFDSVFFYQIFKNFSWLELDKPVAGHRLHGSNKSLQIIYNRVKELAKFEEIKFGRYCTRSIYLFLIALLILFFNKIPFLGKKLNKFIYFCVNSLSFLTFYRFPSI